MIEETLLPVRLVISKLKQFLPNNVSQRLHPRGQGNALRCEGRKEMNVVWHDDIAANGDIMLLGLGGEDAKRLVNFITC